MRQRRHFTSPRVCRSPCGERGLKCKAQAPEYERDESLPVRGAWIEIISCSVGFRNQQVAPRAGSVD